MKRDNKARRKTGNDSTLVEASSGNVFADLGLANAGELFGKAEIAHLICQIIAERELTQVQAAEILGIPQPRVSLLLRGQLSGFSTERLFRFLEALDQDIEIVVRPSKNSRARRVIAWSS